MPNIKKSTMMSKAERVIRIPSIKENAKILASAKADPDAQPLDIQKLSSVLLCPELDVKDSDFPRSGDTGRS